MGFICLVLFRDDFDRLQHLPQERQAMTNHTKTPLTDAQTIEASVVALNNTSTLEYEVVLASFARTLERTISEREGQLRECVELLNESAATFDTLASMRDEKRWDITERIDALLARLKGKP